MSVFQCSEKKEKLAKKRSAQRSGEDTKLAQDYELQKTCFQCTESGQLCIICTKVEEVRTKKMPMVLGIIGVTGV